MCSSLNQAVLKIVVMKMNQSRLINCQCSLLNSFNLRTSFSLLLLPYWQGRLKFFATKRLSVILWPYCESFSMTTTVKCLTSATVLSKYFFLYFKLCPSRLLKGAVLPCCFRYGLDNFFFQVLYAELNGTRLI